MGPYRGGVESFSARARHMNRPLALRQPLPARFRPHPRPHRARGQGRRRGLSAVQRRGARRRPRAHHAGGGRLRGRPARGDARGSPADRGRQARRLPSRSRPTCTAALSPRGFVRSFVLADGMEVSGAELEHGLLHIDLFPSRAGKKKVKQIPIRTGAPELLPRASEALVCTLKEVAQDDTRTSLARSVCVRWGPLIWSMCGR